MQLASRRRSPSSRSTCARFPQRLSSSAVAIVGIAGVVVVFVSVLSIAAGLHGGDAGIGLARPRARDAQRRRQRDDERPRRRRSRRHQAGARASGATARPPLASAELYVIIDLPKKSTPDAPANVPMRGIEPTAMPVRDEVSIVEGRMFQFGTNEVIVGRGASGQFVEPERRRHDRLGPEPLAGRRHLRGRRRRRRDRDLVRRAHAAGRLSPRQHLSVGARAARLDASRFDTFRDWLTVEPAAQRAGPARERILRAAVAGADAADPDDRLRHRGADGHRRGVRRHPDDVHRGVDARRARSRRCARSASTPTSVLVSVLAESLALGAIGGVDRRRSPPTSRSTATRRRR